MEARKENVALIINKIRYIFLSIAILSTFACNTNSNSIPLTNLKVLYEKDAVLNGPLQKKAWHDIACPLDIEHYDSYNDIYHCVCIQDQGWEKIDYLSDVELVRPSITNLNFFWIRGEFYIKDDPQQYCGINLKYVLGRDIIYVNNRLIGIKKVDTYEKLNWPSNYPLPPGILVKGKNTVHLRLEIYEIKNMGVDYTLYLQPKTDSAQTKLWYWVIYESLPGIVFILICSLFIYSIIQIFLDNTKKFHVLSALSLLYYLLLCIVSIIPFKYLNLFYFYGLLYLCQVVFTIIFIKYVQVLYRITVPRVNRIIIPLLSILIIFYGFFCIYLQPAKRFAIMIAIIIVCCLSLMYVLYTVNRLKPDVKKFYLFLSLIIVFMAGVGFDIVSYIINLYDGAVSLVAYVCPAGLLFFLVYGVAFNTLEKNKERVKLEQFYARFIQQKGKQPDCIKITASAEEKLMCVIEFINENYKENLAREDLAATIDINPNYLSTLFNIFTGKNIQEYINMLRIKEAAALIKETDDKIIDIAFSVGYSNLTTFLRAFKKEVGKTPKEYREENNTCHMEMVF